MIITRHVRVIGRVQGVFFRAWTREQARALGVSGWVRNCADGSVEARIEGEADALASLIDRMRQGPSGARVDDMDVENCSPEGARGFEVRH